MTDRKIKITLPAEAYSARAVGETGDNWFMSVNGIEVSASEVEHTGEFKASGSPFWDNEDTRSFRPYNVSTDDDGNGVLFVPVKGALLPDFPYQAGPYATGYEYIKATMDRGAADNSVKAIFIDSNSPGGLTRGCDEVAMAIAAAAKIKPVIAYASDSMASAAYWLCSQASEVHVSTTGEIGSIGVITWHEDISKALEARGVKMTKIASHPDKQSLNPFVPLSEAGLTEMLNRVKAIEDVFTAAVSTARGITVESIKEMKASVFPSHEAVRLGLADRVSTRSEVMAVAFGKQTETTANGNNYKEADMPNPENPAAQAQPTNPTAKDAPVVTPVTTPAADAAAPAVDANAVNVAVAAFAARAQEILSCDEAKGREDQAQAFAFDADMASMPVAKIKAILAKAPAATAAAAAKDANGYLKAMEDSQNPEISAGEQSNPDDGDSMYAAAVASMKSMRS